MECRPNMFSVISLAYALFIALSADASWLYRFSLFPSHLQVQASSFGSAPNYQPAQAPSPASASPSPSPQPFSFSSSSSPASAPQTSSSSSPASAPQTSSSPASAPQTSSSPYASPSPSISDESSGRTQKGTVSQDDPALGDICDKTDYPDLCRSSVVPFLHNKIDHFTVLKLTIDACINHTQAAIHKASELAASNPDATEIVQVCQESYANAVDELKQSALALAGRDLGTFRTKMSSVITSIGTCDETFGEDPDMESSSPLTDIDQTITRLASNILAIGERI